MKPFEVEELDGFPKVILNQTKDVFYFGGKSLPENAKEFFGKIVAWLDEYGKDPNDETNVVFKMDYFNTASSKRILDVLEKLEDIHESGKSKVSIDWYYLEMDEDMLEAGREYANIVDVPFNLHGYE